MKKIILTIFVLIFTIDAKADFIWNENCIKAYKLIMELKFLEGNKILKLEKFFKINMKFLNLNQEI